MSKYQVDRGIWLALTLGWLAQLVSILVDAFAIGLPSPGPVWLRPALSVTTWLVLAVYAIESHRLRLPHIRRALAVLAAGTVVLAWVFPVRLTPVRRSMGAFALADRFCFIRAFWCGAAACSHPEPGRTTTAQQVESAQSTDRFATGPGHAFC